MRDCSYLIFSHCNIYILHFFQELQCQCEQGTCGKSCEKCCPLFNQGLWQPGTYTEGGGCEGICARNELELFH